MTATLAEVLPCAGCRKVYVGTVLVAVRLCAKHREPNGTVTLKFETLTFGAS